MAKIKKIFEKIITVIKNIVKMIQDHMTTQWKAWDKEAEEETKKPQEPEKDLYEQYEDYYSGKKKKKEGD